MRRVAKTLAAALVALLLAVGVAACGGGDDSDSTSTEAAGQQHSQANGASQGKEGGSGESDSSSEDSSGGGGQSGGSDASDFVPKQHNDSGGGSEQFKVKGGDNSVQEFGAEADTSEFDAAATALHNFLDARAEGNWAAACEYVSQPIIESLEKLAAKAKTMEGKSCGEILEKLVNPAASESIKTEAKEADVRSVRTDGEQAFALYTISDGSLFSMPMKNEDGAWKVGSLSGYPLS